MSRRGSVLLALALAGVVARAGAAGAEDGQVQLPQPTIGISSVPPLTSSARPVTELRIPGQLSSDQHVRVGVDGRGRPVAVTATQRLVLNAPGDYIFAIPAPVEDVLPAAGTESRPGFRRGAILWQGFSPGRRVLAALAKLEVAPAVEALPITVSTRTSVGGSELEPGQRRGGEVDVSLVLGNTTGVDSASFGGEGDVEELARILDQTLRSLRTRVPLPAGIVTVHGPTDQQRYRVDVQFRIKGRLVFPRGQIDVTSVSGGSVSRVGRLTRVRFEGMLGGDGPKRLSVRLRGRGRELGAPRLSFEAVPVVEVAGLTPPRGGTWVRAVRERLVEVDGRTMLSTAVATYLRLARTNQYEHYLLNPDVSAGLIRNHAVYAYETASVRAATPPPSNGDSGVGVVGLVALLAGALLAVAAGLVLWAHS